MKNKTINQKQLKLAAVNIKNLRSKKNLSQLELADILGISQGEVSHWECARYFVKKELLKLVCKVLGCNESHLLGKLQANAVAPSTINRIRRINIANLMAERKMSQTVLGEALNPPVKKQFISAVMLSKRNFTDKHLQQIAEIFGIDIKDLDKEPDFSNPTPKTRGNQDYIDLAIEILDSIQFENPKYKSRMFPIAYDIIQQKMEDDSDLDEQIKLEEKQLEFKKLLSKTTNNN